MTDIVERLRRNHGLTHDPDQLWDVVSTLTKERQEAAGSRTAASTSSSTSTTKWARATEEAVFWAVKHITK